MPAHAQPAAPFGLRRPFSFAHTLDGTEGPQSPRGCSIFPMNIHLNCFFRWEDLFMYPLAAYRIGIRSSQKRKSLPRSAEAEGFVKTTPESKHISTRFAELSAGYCVHAVISKGPGKTVVFYRPCYQVQCWWGSVWVARGSKSSSFHGWPIPPTSWRENCPHWFNIYHGSPTCCSSAQCQLFSLKVVLTNPQTLPPPENFYIMSTTCLSSQACYLCAYFFSGMAIHFLVFSTGCGLCFLLLLSRFLYPQRSVRTSPISTVMCLKKFQKIMQ